MSKLYFHYAAMNAGKSTILLQASYNYQERGMQTLLLKPALDERDGRSRIASRIGLAADADAFDPDTDLEAHIQKRSRDNKIACVLVDEAQFLSHEQVWQLACVADDQGIPVMCYGLRTDFRGQPFEGSQALLGLADNLREIRTICWCGAKATMVLRIDENGAAVREGDQVEIGGNDRYVSLCRRHWRVGELGQSR